MIASATLKERNKGGIMVNQFITDIIEKLDTKYDEITYDELMNMLKVTVNKNTMLGDLNDLIRELDKEIMYPMKRFHSDNNTYTFTYQLREEK